MPPTESPITRIPGDWADRHPIAVSIMLAAALVTLVVCFAIGR